MRRGLQKRQSLTATRWSSVMKVRSASYECTPYSLVSLLRDVLSRSIPLFGTVRHFVLVYFSNSVGILLTTALAALVICLCAAQLTMNHPNVSGSMARVEMFDAQVRFLCAAWTQAVLS